MLILFNIPCWDIQCTVMECANITHSLIGLFLAGNISKVNVQCPSKECANNCTLHNRTVTVPARNVHMYKSGVIWSVLELSEVIRNNQELSSAFWSCQESSKIIRSLWSCLEASELSGVIWCCLESSWVVWSRLESSWGFWSCLESSGVIWSYPESPVVVCSHL